MKDSICNDCRNLMIAKRQVRGCSNGYYDTDNLCILGGTDLKQVRKCNQFEKLKQNGL